MRNEEETGYCTNPDCRVAETGRCVEGLELGSCPHYGHEVSSDDAGDETNLDEDPVEFVSENIRLPSAATLTCSGASSILRQGTSRVIAVLGPSDSGKTSLIASIYDLFQLGPVGGMEFTRSQTLHAFEESCHNARAASRRTEPEMGRTPYGSVRFYHMEIGGCPDQDEEISLLLGDRAGEEYLAARNDLDTVAEFSEVIRADILTVLVDGERLVDIKRRHNLLIDIKMVLQALSDGGVLPMGIRLALVLTKLDVVSSSHRNQRALADFTALAQDIERLFDNTFVEIETFKIAASPKTATLQRGTGVCELLKFWLGTTRVASRLTRSPVQSFRAFSRLRPIDEPLGESSD